MDFKEHELSEIKWKTSNIWWYVEILQTMFNWNIYDCLSWTIDIYYTNTDPVDRYILVFDGEQIADCKVIADHSKKTFFVSSIAVISNLQKNWIASKLYNEIIIPKMKKKYPKYWFVPSWLQTDLWKKLRKTQSDFTQSPAVPDTRSEETEK